MFPAHKKSFPVGLLLIYFPVSEQAQGKALSKMWMDFKSHL